MRFFIQSGLRVFISCLLVLQVSCFGATSNSIGAGGDSSSSGSESASFETGEPIDIPIPIAKSKKPIDGRRVKMDYDGSQIVINGLSDAMEFGSTGLAFDSAGNLLAEFTPNADGSFTVELEDKVSFGEPIILLVKEGDAASPPIIATMKDEAFFTIAITNRTSISEESLAYHTDFGIIYNGLNSSGTPGLLFTPESGGNADLLSDAISSPLDQIHVCGDGTFLVGLNTSGQILRVEMDSGDVTILSDSAIQTSSPTILLSPSCSYVTSTTLGSGDAAYPILEPTALSSSQLSDRIQINSSTTDTYKECAWVGNEILLCLKQTPADVYQTELLNLYPPLQAGSKDVSITPVAIRSFANTVRRIRVEPITRAYYTFEEQVAGIFELHFDDFSEESTLVDQSADYVDLANSGWSADGTYIFYDLKIATANGERTVVGNYNVSTGERKLLTVGTKPIGIGSDIFAYLCQDISGETQICIGNLGD